MQSGRMVNSILAGSPTLALKAAELSKETLVVGQLDAAGICYGHQGEVKLALIFLALLVSDPMLTKLCYRPLCGEPIPGNIQHTVAFEDFGNFTNNLFGIKRRLPCAAEVDDGPI